MQSRILLTLKKDILAVFNSEKILLNMPKRKTMPGYWEINRK